MERRIVNSVASRACRNAALALAAAAYPARSQPVLPTDPPSHRLIVRLDVTVNCGPSTRPDTSIRVASGVIVGARGERLYLLTPRTALSCSDNYAAGVTASFHDQSVPGFPASILTIDEASGIGVLSIGAVREKGMLVESLPFLSFRDVAQLRRGETVYIVGVTADTVWYDSRAPLRVMRKEGEYIEVDLPSPLTGLVGATVLDSESRIMAMVTSASDGRARAQGLRSVLDRLRAREFPIQLGSGWSGPLPSAELGRYVISSATPVSDSREIDEVSRQLMTRDHMCVGVSCGRDPERVPYTIDLAVREPYELREPRLTCLSGPCSWSHSRGAVLTSPQSARASFEVWSAPTTWVLSAKRYQRDSRLVTDTLSQGTLFVGRDITVNVSKKAVRAFMVIQDADGEALVRIEEGATGKFVRVEKTGETSEHVTFRIRVTLPGERRISH